MVTRTTNFGFELIAFDTKPWNEKHHDNWRLADAVLAQYVAISGIAGVWQNAIAVTVGQRYVDPDDGTIYNVDAAHTTPSSGTFSAARGATSGQWTIISTSFANRGAFAVNTSYSLNDFVTDAGRIGVVAVAFTSTGADTYDLEVTAGTIVTLVDLGTVIAATHDTNTVAAGGTPTATYDSSTLKFDFGLVTGNTGATGAAGADYTADLELNAIAGLTSAADQLPFFTGSGTAALATLTAAARTVLDDATVAAMLATLGGVGPATTNALTNKTFDANGTGNVLSNIDIGNAIAASQAEAEAGTNTTKLLTPLRVAQAIAALASSGPTLGTEQASTSGSTITFGSIPTGTKQIIISFVGISSNGTGAYTVRIGDAGGLETTGYLGNALRFSSTAGLVTALTTAFSLSPIVQAAGLYHGQMILTLEDSSDFTWSMSSTIANTTDHIVISTGTKSLSAELTQLAVITANTWDAGVINIQYQ